MCELLGTIAEKTMKYLLFLFNFVFVLTGISLIVIGVIMKSQPEMDSEFQPILKDHDNYTTAPNLLIVVGVFIFIVAFFGCCGTLRENHCMLFTFSVFMVAIFIAEIAIGLTGYALKAEAEDILATPLNETLTKYNSSTGNTKELWDDMQITFDCCGVRNYTDWYPILNNTLPSSCCGVNASVKTCNPMSPSLHRSSCLTTISTAVKENSSTIGLAGIIVAAVQLLGVIFSCHLARSYKSSYESV